MIPITTNKGITVTSKELSKVNAIDIDNAVYSVNTFEEALNAFDRIGAEIVATSDLGDGFQLLSGSAKEYLVNMPFVVTGVVYAKGDYTNDDGEQMEFAVIRVIAKDNNKYVFTDGGRYSVY